MENASLAQDGIEVAERDDFFTTMRIGEIPEYICLAAGEDSLLLLQICTRDEKLLKNGDPVQFVVAWHPDWYCGELTWSNGSYYPLYGAGYMWTGCASALVLLEAALHLTGNAAHGTEKGGLRSDPNVR